MEYKTAREIRDAISNGDISSAEVTKYYLDQIKLHDEKIGAFLEVFEDEALEAAKKIDEMKASGESLPRLAGVPVAIKDNLLYAAHMSSASSNMLKSHKAAYTATAVQKLIDAGAVIIGRTNMDEFAMGSSTESSAFQKTHNPWDLDRIPGGSSGGSAAAVAAGLVPVALGSDTGGSIRQPAAVCGVSGFKPTYGRVSRYGLIAMASSLDQIGAFANTAEDIALIHEVIDGQDDNDATSREVKDLPIAELLNEDVKGLRIGIPKEYFIDGIDDDVRLRTKTAINELEKAGATIVEISLPLTEYALPTYYITMPAEVSSNLARFDGMRYGDRAAGPLLESYKQARGTGLGTEVKRRIILGTYILSAGYYDAYYKKAQAVRTVIQKEMNEAFENVDVIVTPTTPSPAWKLGEKSEDPLEMYLADIFTTTANIAGIPAISIPCGLTDSGLPIGLQIMGPADGDDVVLRAAHAFQSITRHHENAPKL